MGCILNSVAARVVFLVSYAAVLVWEAIKFFGK